MQCQAKAKSSGVQCRRFAVAGRAVCTVHGGLTPRGMASPHFKTGRHSRDLPTQLASRYLEAMSDADLLSLRDDIALIDARVAELLEAITDDPDAWETIIGLIEARRKLADTERRRLVDLKQMMTAEQAMTLLAAIVDTVKRHVSDPKALQAISQDLGRLVDDNKLQA